MLALLSLPLFNGGRVLCYLDFEFINHKSHKGSQKRKRSLNCVKTHESGKYMYIICTVKSHFFRFLWLVYFIDVGIASGKVKNS